MMSTNIFSTLARYCGSEENFLTESFVYVINEILKRELEQGKTFLQKIIGNEYGLFSEIFQVSVTTQLSLLQGRPDICIQTSPDSLFFIEVKHDSQLHPGQLEAYYSELINSGKPKIKLILLTRSKQTAIQTTLSRKKFRQVCWYEIFNWLFNLKITDEICKFLIGDFLLFLEEKAMNLVRVEWEYANGIKSLINLTNMLEAALEEVYDVKLKKTGGWFWRGYYVDTIFCGVRYDRPQIITYENNMGSYPTFKEEFDLDKEHFLAFSKEEQLECLVKFISETAKEYKTLHLDSTTLNNAAPMEDTENQ